MAVIEIDRLTKYYKNKRGIEKINCEIRAGETVGLIGPEDAGKTTLIRVLLNLIKPTSGNAYIFDMNIEEDGALIRKRIGYINSGKMINTIMKAENFLLYGASFYDNPASGIRILELLKMFDINLDKRIIDMPDDEKKKVGIISALAHQPELLILDEPFQSLDNNTRRRLLDILEIENERGTTILYVSRELGAAENFISRVIMIRDGRVMRSTSAAGLSYSRHKAVVLSLSRHIFDINHRSVENLRIRGTEVEFDFFGHPEELMHLMNGLPVVDFTVRDEEY